MMDLSRQISTKQDYYYILPLFSFLLCLLFHVSSLLLYSPFYCWIHQYAVFGVILDKSIVE